MPINSDQALELTFMSGVTAQGTIAAQSFWTWNDDLPATYSSFQSYQAKWGAAQAGTGATITVAFDTASNWTATEQNAFIAAMHLWSAEANITFDIVSVQTSAEVVISRSSDGTAEGGIDYYYSGNIGSSQLGTAISGSIKIDTSIGGFGPIGASFATAGGYPWETIEHELGHVIGLGHAGAYNDGTTDTSPMYTSYDTTAWSIMSYNDAPDESSAYVWGSSGGYARGPVTPMALDILAAQRLYGAPVNSPLSGGQVFGFNTNIQGDIAQFFDFTINTKPIITLFDTGTGNTLDLSGYTTSSAVDLHDGAFSSAAGLQDNIAIAYGTRIDTAIGGTGADRLVGNDDGDVLMGGSGSDTITGGAGNDHIYGNMLSSIAGSTDGADVIDTGGGSNYVNGNAGDDTISASQGTNRLYGGQGNDHIAVTGNGTSHLNGNLGDDILIVAGGSNDIHGGQGNDQIIPTGGNNQSFGEIGNDVIWGGTGIDVMTGGPGSDLFVLSGPANTNLSQWDEITDFTGGTDKLHIDLNGASSATVLHATQAFSSESAAAAYAQTAFQGASGVEAAALQVGSDTYLFYTSPALSSSLDEVVKLDGVTASTITSSDFVMGTTHL